MHRNYGMSWQEPTNGKPALKYGIKEKTVSAALKKKVIGFAMLLSIEWFHIVIYTTHTPCNDWCNCYFIEHNKDCEYSISKLIAQLYRAIMELHVQLLKVHYNKSYTMLWARVIMCCAKRSIITSFDVHHLIYL